MEVVPGGTVPVRRSASCLVRVATWVRAEMTVSLALANDFVRDAFVAVKLATAVRSAAVAVARFAIASMVLLCW